MLPYAVFPSILPLFQSSVQLSIQNIPNHPAKPHVPISSSPLARRNIPFSPSALPLRQRAQTVNRHRFSPHHTQNTSPSSSSLYATLHQASCANSSSSCCLDGP
ncbi:uncharacterized protein K460DRAFT_10569 [Cucurbitaria berberidis CBS 394.84]|uniref:Uncharacterized protein n=1 Tax=Cucurbitaria berberidis CBS 394.84 TaxID=1168544 RepID=A0A9P4GS68_9PLEO|nr:uncharacterized protein K460DRAFT_10569 [Cucurbitaria berberidis CBS 394.84]KAF1850091.1 hypothetical protein K460DRAFT_10569 [Cucurbitaria berberidis CBS 394.84]